MERYEQFKQERDTRWKNWIDKLIAEKDDIIQQLKLDKMEVSGNKVFLILDLDLPQIVSQFYIVKVESIKNIVLSSWKRFVPFTRKKDIFALRHYMPIVAKYGWVLPHGHMEVETVGKPFIISCM